MTRDMPTEEAVAVLTDFLMTFGHEKRYDDAFSIAIEALEAEPIKHGRWIDKGDYAICSECGGDSGTQYDGIMPIPRYSKYCPNCGAIMDEVEHG